MKLWKIILIALLLFVASANSADKDLQKNMANELWVKGIKQPKEKACNYWGVLFLDSTIAWANVDSVQVTKINIGSWFERINIDGSMDSGGDLNVNYIIRLKLTLVDSVATTKFEYTKISSLKERFFVNDSVPVFLKNGRPNSIFRDGAHFMGWSIKPNRVKGSLCPFLD